jgi:hypothetical protein
MNEACSIVDEGFERARSDQGSTLGVVVGCLKKRQHAFNLIDLVRLQKQNKKKRKEELRYAKLSQQLRMG